MIVADKLFSLLRSALWGEAFRGEVSKDEFAQVLKVAKEQTVLGLVFDVLKDVKVEGAINKSLIFETIGITEQIKRQNAQINKELCSFAERCQDAGLKYLVVKGQTIGCFYANPGLRSSGDIDFLIPEYLNGNLDFNRVFTDVEIPKRISEKEYGFDSNGVTYELHTRLIDFGCKKHQRIWEGIIAEEWTLQKPDGRGKMEDGYFVTINGVKVRTLSPTVNAVYLFLHLYFHLIREGVSLRQFCDWAIMLHHYRNDIDKEALEDILQQLDMIRGYRAFGTILVDELGLPEEEFPLPLAEDDRGMKKKILEDIFKGGNFGKHNHKAKSAFGFKMETFRMALNNSIRYHSLAPSEMRMMIPKMLRINLRLLFG